MYVCARTVALVAACVLACIQIQVYICIHVYMYIRIYIQIRIYRYIQIYMYVRIYTYAYVYIYIYMYIHKLCLAVIAAAMSCWAAILKRSRHTVLSWLATHTHMYICTRVATLVAACVLSCCSMCAAVLQHVCYLDLQPRNTQECRHIVMTSCLGSLVTLFGLEWLAVLQQVIVSFTGLFCKRDL